MKPTNYIIGLLFLLAVTTWLSVFSVDKENLRIIACDVGQGDAVLAVYKETQILFDGGPGKKVLSCLSENIPFWDREIEVVILTHPQDDHYSGLVGVFENYEVQTFVASSLDISSQKYQVLEDLVRGSQAQIVNPKEGSTIRVGLIYLDILWPTQEFQLSEGVSFEENVLGVSTTNDDLNDFSIVANLRLGEFDALMTGDIGPSIAEKIITTGRLKDVDYIKVPHHGSKNGLTRGLLEKTSPEVAVITVGRENSYGHPHKEVILMLEEFGIVTKRTDLDGQVEVVTNGKSWWVEN